MATQTDLGARLSSEETAGSRLVRASSPERGAAGTATNDRGSAHQQGLSVLEQFMHNLMLALGAWHS